MSTTDYLWIDSTEPLATCLATLNPHDLIAVDTEADSLHHYRESLCLVQISQHGHHFLVDPLAKFDLTPLWNLFAQSTIILHGADYDLRLMRRAGCPLPKAVYDTQLAAQILGLTAFGYAPLVEQFYGEKLCKASQREDWSQRPLTEKMLAYAVQDTRYLEGLVEKMQTQLQALGRTSWHEQSCQRVMAVSQVDRPDDPDSDWLVTGSTHLSPHSRAILKAIWHWREAEAELADLPPFKVMSNEKIVGLAQWAEHHHFKSTLPPAFRWKYPRPERERRLLEAMTAGKDSPPLAPPPRAKREPRDPDFDRRFEQFKARRDAQAKALNLDASFIAAKTTLIELAKNPEAANDLIAQSRWCAWQAALLQEPPDTAPQLNLL